MKTPSNSGGLSQVCAGILRLWPLKKWVDVKTIVAVSGGPDSVALLRGLCACSEQASRSLIAGHVNHGTRGTDSTEDERFVKELAAQLGIGFESSRLQPESAHPPEAWLRKHRYEALVKMARAHGARYIATAHNRDDQVETVVLRMFRGTGPKGLAGIPVHRPAGEGITIIRPLLDTPRSIIEQTLQEIEQPFRIDNSNFDSGYTRNFLRHELLPLARDKFGGRIDELIVRLSAQVHEQQMLLDSLAADLDGAVQLSNSVLEFDCAALKDENDVILRQLIVRNWNQTGWPVAQMDFFHWQNICSMIKLSDVGPAINLPGNIRAERIGNCLRLAPQT
ncbi:MAG: tRNA lysidine(34) synthetase TilS [Planctomycetota bacterium]